MTIYFEIYLFDTIQKNLLLKCSSVHKADVSIHGLLIKEKSLLKYLASMFEFLRIASLVVTELISYVNVW